MQVFEIRNQVRITVRDILKTFDNLTIDDVPELNSILAVAKALVMNIAEATLMTSSISNDARLFIFGDLNHPLELDHLFNQQFNQHPFNHPFDQLLNQPPMLSHVQPPFRKPLENNGQSLIQRPDQPHVQQFQPPNQPLILKNPVQPQVQPHVQPQP